MSKKQVQVSTTAQPTPGPWYQGQLNYKGQVLSGPEGGEEVICDGVSEPDAAHIIHCVNTYPVLVEALENLLYEPMAERTVDAAKKALALARKET